MAIRINPNELTFTAISGTGVANAVGPYRFRPGRAIGGVTISGTSSNATDVVQVAVVEPGGAAPTTNTAEIPYIVNKGSAQAALTVPFSATFDAAQLGGPCDIYVYATTNTGSITVNIKRMERNGGQ